MASGLSIHLGVSVKSLRLIFTLLGITGAGVMLYLWLWLGLPRTGSLAPDPSQRIAKPPVEQLKQKRVSTSRLALIVGGAFLLVAFITGVGPLLGLQLVSGRNAAILAILAGLMLIWTQSEHVRAWRKNPQAAVLVGLGLLLLLSGTVGLVNVSASRSELLFGMGVGVVIILALVLAFLPPWIKMNRELTDTSVARAKETQRADIAAHLHDSVLQTLTLIKTHADEPARVRGLALEQERALRSWLYTGRGKPGDSTQQLLRSEVEKIETTYGCEVELVQVSDAKPTSGYLAAVSAAAEAVKNAVRHGQPPISVYCEVSSGAMAVYVRDRGTGFDLETVPADRHGVRESIIGRVRRAGGRASLRTLTPGTEVNISMPKEGA